MSDTPSEQDFPSRNPADPTQNRDVEQGYRPPPSTSLSVLLRDGQDGQFRQLIHALLVTSGRLASCRTSLGKLVGVTGAQYSILMAVAHLQGSRGAAVTAIAKYLHVAAAHVTAEVSKIIEDGLLSKLADPMDGRAVLIQLMPEGEQVLEKAAPLGREINDILFEGVSAREFDVLLGFYDKFVANSERALHRVAEREGSRRRRVRNLSRS